MDGGEIEGMELGGVIGRVFVWRILLRFERDAIFVFVRMKRMEKWGFIENGEGEKQGSGGFVRLQQDAITND
jgi:hypothetical protein